MLTAESALRKDRRTTTTMEHRHFAFIAQTIATLPRLSSNVDVMMHFAQHLANTNPRFDRARFIKACGL